MCRSCSAGTECAADAVYVAGEGARAASRPHEISLQWVAPDVEVESCDGVLVAWVVGCTAQEAQGGVAARGAQGAEAPESLLEGPTAHARNVVPADEAIVGEGLALPRTSPHIEVGAEAARTGCRRADGDRRRGHDHARAA